MKTLQNNFTTPEQSKRLLAMGIPANTADLYYERHSEIKFERLNIRLNKIELADDFFEKHSLYTPHWSVGRLIEIFEKCTGERFSREIDASTLQLIPLIEDVIAQIEKHLKIMIYRRLDLSKLEE